MENKNSLEDRIAKAHKVGNFVGHAIAYAGFTASLVAGVGLAQLVYKKCGVYIPALSSPIWEPIFVLPISCLTTFYGGIYSAAYGSVWSDRYISARDPAYKIKMKELNRVLREYDLRKRKEKKKVNIIKQLLLIQSLVFLISTHFLF